MCGVSYRVRDQRVPLGGDVGANRARSPPWNLLERGNMSRYESWGWRLFAADTAP